MKMILHLTLYKDIYNVFVQHTSVGTSDTPLYRIGYLIVPFQYIISTLYNHYSQDINYNMALIGEDILDLMMSQTDLHLTQYVHDELKIIHARILHAVVHIFCKKAFMLASTLFKITTSTFNKKHS